MNQTSEPGSPSGGPATPPGGTATQDHPAFNRDQLGSIDRLRRSRTDRHIAGVAGGLAQHFDIDPMIVRVVLVVLTFFGGAGLLVYGAIWLLVPEEGSADAPLRVNAEPRKILLLAVLGIAFLLAIGDSFGHFGLGWPLASIAVLFAVFLIIRDRRSDSRSVGSPTANATGSNTVNKPVVPEAAAPGPEQSNSPAVQGTTAGEPPAWQPPPPPVPEPVPRRPRRTGIIWFWPTLALVAIGLGILGIVDSGSNVVDGAYPALALAIVGVMLVIGSIVGRPGGLILLGVLTLLALAATSLVGGKFGIDAEDMRVAPVTAAAVQPEYDASVGSIRLDLTRIADPQNLAGREIDLDLRAGEVQVILPRSLNTHVDAAIRFAGGITIPGHDSGGINHSVERNLPGFPATTSPTLDLEIDLKVGQITVEYR